MNKEIKNIGIPSKGRLKNDTLKIFVKKNLKIHSERGERDLFGYIKNSPNIKIIFVHARDCIDQLSIGNIDIYANAYIFSICWHHASMIRLKKVLKNVVRFDNSGFMIA